SQAKPIGEAGAPVSQTVSPAARAGAPTGAASSPDTMAAKNDCLLFISIRGHAATGVPSLDAAKPRTISGPHALLRVERRDFRIDCGSARNVGLAGRIAGLHLGQAAHIERRGVARTRGEHGVLVGDRGGEISRAVFDHAAVLPRLDIILVE